MRRDRDFESAAGKRPLGIYVHIPFCKKKCLYCDFLSAPATEDVIAEYVEALCARIGQEKEAYREYLVRSVFFGGGTPSLLPPAQVEKIMTALTGSFQLARDAEITLEANPGTLEAEKLSGYRSLGINRLSIGLQSASDAELLALGRIHTWAEFLQNYDAAKKAGFSNINVDLMSALPGQTLSGWLDTLRRVAALMPEHISAYSLIIEEGTPFYERYGAGTTLPGFLPLPTEEEERRMYEETESFLRQQGYHRYEISNYAKPGCECVHNTGYWQRTDYAGFGTGAASLVNNVRWKNTENLQKYMNISEPVRQELQSLSRTEQMEEFMFLGLRLTAGIAVADFRRQFQTGIEEIYGTVLKRLEQDGLILFYEDGKRLRLTSRGVDVSNYVLAQFLLD